MDKFPIHGIAIRAGVSRNNIKYLPEELEKFAPTLSNRPILKDHVSATDNAIGLVESSSYLKETVPYKGWIKDDATAEKIDDGRIKEVSIGAIAERIVLEDESDENSAFLARGLTGIELSTTPTPGVAGTSIKQCLKELEEAETPKERSKVAGIQENVADFREIIEKIKLKEDENMPKENIKETKVEEDEEKDDAPDAEESVKESAFDKLVEKLDAVIKTNDKTKELEEKLADFEKKLSESKTKGDVTTEAPKPLYNMIKEKNRYAPGKVDIRTDDVCY